MDRDFAEQIRAVVAEGTLMSVNSRIHQVARMIPDAGIEHATLIMLVLGSMTLLVFMLRT